MPKDRKKSVYRNYTDEGFQQAVNAVKSGRVSQRKAASLYNIPQATLSDHLRGRSTEGISAGRKPVFTPDVEHQMVQKCSQAAEMGLGMTKNQVLEKVGHLAKEMKLKTPFTKSRPGKDWWYGFKARNPSVTLRSPEKLTNVRVRGLNPQKVGEYFLDLELTIIKLKLDDKPEAIWNMDEKGASLEHNPSKVVAAKSARRIPGRVADTRERNTIVSCINGIGRHMPPLIIVKGKTQKSVLSWNTAEGPLGSKWTFQENAWTEDVLGVEWFENIFLKECGEQRPQLLVLDGHHSHEVLGLIENAKANNIELLTLPPHTTHYLCPLDRCVFGPYNSEYDKVCTEFCQTPGNTINKISWPGLFRKAFEKSHSKQNIVAGFRACGIVPWNPLNIPKAAFMPSNAFNVSVQSDRHPLEWATTKQSDTEHQQESGQSTVTKATVAITSSATATLATPSGDHVLSDQVEAVIEAPGSPDNSCFTCPQSADKFLPVLDTETMEAVETLISLESSQIVNNDIVYEVSLDTSILENTTCILPISTGEQNTITSTSTVADWNMSINDIFSVSPRPLKKEKSTKCVGHRLLTSDEVIGEKRKVEEMKKTKELNKQKRLKIKELVSAKKLLEQ